MCYGVAGAGSGFQYSADLYRYISACATGGGGTIDVANSTGWELAESLNEGAGLVRNGATPWDVAASDQTDPGAGIDSYAQATFEAVQVAKYDGANGFTFGS